MLVESMVGRKAIETGLKQELTTSPRPRRHNN